MGWFWYLGTLVPVIGIVQLGSQSMADRYTYIPMIGIMIVLVWGACELTKRLRLHVVILSTTLAVLTIACIARTRDELPYWKDNITVWTRAIAVTKDNFMAHYKLGVMLWASSQQNQALNELQEAVRINPDFAMAHKYLGTACASLERIPEAFAHYKKGLELAPDDAATWFNYALCCCKMGRLNDALASCQKSQAIGGDPSRQHWINLILQHQALAKQQNADLRAALEKNPDRGDAIDNLAWFLATTVSEDERNGVEAVQLATRACELSHNNPACVATLAAAYAETGQSDKAITTIDLACSLAEKTGDEPSLKYFQKLRECFSTHMPCYELSVYNNLPTQP